MLVATPGQTAAYTLHSGSGSAPKKSCHTSTAAPKSASSSNNNNNNINAHNTARPIAESPNAVDALMKSLSVRLNRSTEYLHKAFGTATTATAAATNTTTTGNSNIINSTIKTATNNYSSGAKSNKDNAAAMAVSSSTTSSFAAAAAATVRAAKAMRAAQLAKAATANATARKLNTVPPTVIHRYSEERLHTSSTDSLHKEMCHFKPIRAAPTTPWKCGSKSRGASLRMPKASLATNEQLNCDVSLAAGKKKDAESDDDGEGDATIAYNTPYRPKPSSTVLTTIISTPSHQSAFVCLVAKMKNLVNIKTAKQSSSKSNKILDLHKTRNIRGRKRTADYPMKQLKQSPINVPLTKLILRNRQQPFVHVKKLHLPKELIIKKSVRKARAGKGDAVDTVKSTASVMVNSGSKSGSKRPTASISVSARRTRVRAAKSKIINIVAFAQESNNSIKKCNISAGAGAAGDSVISNETKRRQRKRKHSRDASERRQDGVSAVASVGSHGVVGSDSSLPPVRKSARLSKDCSMEVLQIMAVKTVGKRKRAGRELAKRTADCFSPPLTRSRLRQLTQLQPTVQQNVA